ncbi:39S ribosomal protein L17, mitochondrial isoform X2 [Coturnix japonica]|uniref:39S ribosomal protein L17, mitochondrial isoform X2 n=1 Tax=Coturnix japonica TaxID=93934 RepID=UPI000777C9F6|nr:39S ribosomal protein L17, mitochondrial isoform X2 [Coturnix japonica]
MRLSVWAAISHGRVYRRLGHGPRSRLDLLRNLVTALVRHERIEAPWARADEMRGYAEREKDLIHKLFKVLAPRYQPHPGSYTRMLHIPNRDNLDRAKMAVIELKGNPFPPLIQPRRDSEKTLLNQLLKGCREDAQRAAGP